MDCATAAHPFVGLWVTEDGIIRHGCWPKVGTRRRGDREAALTGHYRVEGTTIHFRDDTGFTAEGESRADAAYPSDA